MANLDEDDSNGSCDGNQKTRAVNQRDETLQRLH